MIDRLAGGVLLAAAVPIGLLGGVAALIGGVLLTDNRTAGLAAAALAVLAFAAYPAARGARRLASSPRGRRALAAAVPIGTLALAAVVAWGVFLSPAPATAVSPDGTRFWDLPTGSRIAYQHAVAAEPTHATPVIVVHGGPGSPDRRAATVASTLAKAGFDVYSYHQLGAGLSSREEDVGAYTVARHVADLEAIRVMLGVERISLVGASWGAQLIASYIAEHPDRVERAVVSSPAPLWAAAYTDATRLTAGGRLDQQAVLGHHQRFLLAHVLLSALGPGAASALLPDDQVDGAFEAMVGDLDMLAGCPGRSAASEPDDPSVGRGFGFWVNAATTRDARSVPDPRPALRVADVPVLVLRGECDYLAWEVTREYRDVLPSATLVAVDDAGHVIPADRPDLYGELVRAFLLGETAPLAPYTADAEPWGR